MDALTHALETYVSTGANPLTDAAALESMKLIAENLRNAVYNGENIEARENMANASVLAGFAFNNGGLGYVHAMAHQLGGFYDMPHGIANAILLPYVEKFNLGAKLERFARIAEIFGVNTEGMSTREAAEASLEAIKELAQDIGIPTSLSESKFDIKEVDFEEMAKYALEDGNAGTNPRKGTVEQVKAIFEDAM
jgi:1,3-propanediol dehydrogenase